MLTELVNKTWIDFIQSPLDFAHSLTKSTARILAKFGGKCKCYEEAAKL